MNKSQCLILLIPLWTLVAFKETLCSPLIDEKEIVLEFKSIKSIMQSSLKKYDGWFLFIGEIQNLQIIDESETKSSEIPKGNLIEVLTPISSCRKEIFAAFTNSGKTTLRISNVVETMMIPTPDDPSHDYFLKVEPILNEERNKAECRLIKYVEASKGKQNECQHRI